MSGDITGVDRQVFDALCAAAKSDQADVSFTDLLIKGASVRDIREALARLKSLKYVSTLTFYGIGPEGRVLRDREIAEMAAAAEAKAA